MMEFEGDVLISQFDGENYDIEFINGQTTMTKTFNNLVFFYVFGEDSPYNETANNENEKMKSEFPEIVKRATVTDNTLSRGSDAIKAALAPLIEYSMASAIEVFGKIISAYRMGWQIEIDAPGVETSKYFIIWDKGIINSGSA
jgi:uncharacterized membrane protein